MRTKIILLVFLLISFGSYCQTQSQGNLVIVGGGLESSNESVFNQLIALAGGPDKASFAIIPSASGVAMQSLISFKKILISYHVKPENIHPIEIAMVDDDSTVNVNESEWKDNANDPKLAALVRSCSAVWFTGGDQIRTTKTLVRPDGTKTLVLEAVWDVFKSGGVIGGTSAGAAIMSNPMIGGGNSLSALAHGVVTDYHGDDFPEDQGVMLLNGLGFFPAGIVDQHFNQRSRIGRLATVLLKEMPQFSKGFGVDENTALIYMGSSNLIRVAGASGVTILDATNARITHVQNLARIEDLTLSFLEEGDSYDITTGKISPAAGKRPTRGKEYYNVKCPGQAGVLSGHSSGLVDLMTIHLIDNKGTDVVNNISFWEQNSGFQVTLRKIAGSEGYITTDHSQEDKYTVVNIKMDITPVQISINPLK